VRLSRAERLLRQRLAANVRRVRAARGLTIQDAAEQMGLHWRHLQKVEAGDTNATLQTLARIADTLGVSASELLR